MKHLLDTNVLVYLHDPRYPDKQATAERVLRDGVAANALVVPHQAIVEFVAAVRRPRREIGDRPLLVREEALREAEELMTRLPVLYPDEAVLRTALLGTMTYQLSWFDAHLWAYAEVNGLPEIVSEDFAHGRHYGSVRAKNPFLAAAGSVSELPPMYES